MSLTFIEKVIGVMILMCMALLVSCGVVTYKALTNCHGVGEPGDFFYLVGCEIEPPSEEDKS